MKAEDPPKNENPTAEFAADPPEATLLSGIIVCNFSISSFSTGLHDPGSIPWSFINSKLTSAKISTIALPTNKQSYFIKIILTGKHHF